MSESSANEALSNASGTWRLDPESTSIEFHTKAMWGLAKVKGTFSAESGSAVVGDQGAISGDLVVNAASIDTENKKRDEHLRSADFFEVSKYPTFTFSASEATPSRDGKLNIKGALLIKGKSQPIEFVEATTRSSPDRMTLETQVAIDRRQWGMTWAKLGSGLVNRVVVVAQFERS